ncbi:hypothetical protein GSI_09729 [Ganoderma sinense ZZ0214-1]|uniref:Uncharacterized protein n=1 Tax=Ganoderma sinense ZZ0214-1 TaxID=1077348 RepID=A0A2G8S365_9APHY|nr:hypothetical protein GSI_09729 [Ganoderma sinense ZZ0214-1]
MSSASRSPTREPYPSYSPPPPWDPRTIRVRILIYILDHAYPLVHTMNLTLDQPFRLRDSMWFQQAISGDYRRDINLWRRKYEDWATVNRDEVEISVTAYSSTFILRLPHVRHCVGLGREIQAREDFRLQHDGMLPVRPRELCDIRVPRPEKIGDDFIVVVYPAMVDAPHVFVIRLELNGLIAIWDYPALAQACFGCVSPEDAIEIGIRIWNPQRARFDFYDARDALYAVEGYDFVLIRHEYNRYAPRLGKYIAELEMQTMRGVFPTNIPFGDPTHTPLARPAQSIRVKRDVTWYEHTHTGESHDTEGSDSEESSGADHDEDEMDDEATEWESQGAEGINNYAPSNL